MGATGFGIAEMRWGYATGPSAGSPAGATYTCQRIDPVSGAVYCATGLSPAWARFFTAIAASVSAFRSGQRSR